MTSAYSYDDTPMLAETELTTSITTSYQSSTPEATVTGYQTLPLSTAHASQTNVNDYSYEEILPNDGKGVIYQFQWDSVAKAPFGDLCPGGNCLKTCQDYEHIFQPTQDYNSQGSNLTLFGICSNLGMIYGDLYQANASDFSAMQDKSAYFPPGDQSLAVVNQVVSSLSSCLVGSCEASRDPRNCNASCSLSILDYGNTTMNITAVGSCLKDLCSNTCGLPYANQDLYGVGVLLSYYIQAAIVLFLASFIICQDMRCPWGRNKQVQIRDRSTNSDFQKFMKSFLGAQCYFGISLQAAALYSKPNNVNPLNGYATISVALTGFVPTVFTFTLLQYRGARSRYLSLLVVVCWLLATVVFFELESNLTKFQSRASIEDSSLRQLYDIPTCGGSSALALCYQTIGSSPLGYLSGYYNNGPGFASLKNTNILWAWSTFCLILCLISQFSSASQKRAPSISGKTKETLFEKLQSIFYYWRMMFSRWKMIALDMATLSFFLCFVYETLMVWKYKEMDVIDWTGWTFGQIMAVATWFPSIFEAVENKLSGWWKKRQQAKDISIKEYPLILMLSESQSPYKPPRSSVDSEHGLDSTEVTPSDQGMGSYEGQDTGDDRHLPETQLLSQNTEYHHGL